MQTFRTTPVVLPFSKPPASNTEVPVSGPLRDAVEVRRGPWRCTITADSRVRVVRRKRSAFSLAFLAVGLAAILIGVVFPSLPELLVAGGVVAFLGADSYTRLRPINVVTLEDKGQRTEAMTSHDESAITDFVREITGEIDRLKASKQTNRAQQASSSSARAV